MNRALLINRLRTVVPQDRKIQDVLRVFDNDLISLIRQFLTRDEANTLISAALVPHTLRPAQITGTQNNYVPGRLQHGTTIFIGLDADRFIHGLSSIGVPDGMLVRIINESAFVLTLKDSHAGSLAVNQFLGQGGGDVVVNSGFGATLIYDLSVKRWRAREE